MTSASMSESATQNKSYRIWRDLKQTLSWYPFIAVNILVFLTFDLIPWGRMFALSFQHWDMLGDKTWAGLENYVTLFSDKLLAISLRNTFAYAGMYVPVMSALSLLVAILVNRKMFGMKTFRWLYFVPNVTSISVLSLIFWRLLSPRPDAPVNYLLGLVGIPAQDFLVGLHQALPSLAGLAVWQTFGYYMVLWLAGLQGVPSELYDAGRVDGAEGWKLHWYVTLPLLRPTAAFIIVVSTIGALQVFGSIYIMTGGGPVYATTTIAYHIYSRAFNFYQLGYSSTMSIVYFLLIITITLIQGKYLRFAQSVY